MIDDAFKIVLDVDKQFPPSSLDSHDEKKKFNKYFHVPGYFDYENLWLSFKI